MNNLCKCGCNKPVIRSKLYPYNWNKFIHGHNWRGKHRKTSWNKLPKETRICKCGCEQTFECKCTSNKKYIQGHAAKGKIAHNAGPKETRVCKCGCGKTFECPISRDKKYFTHGHHCKDKPAHNKLPRENRICKCGCNQIFRCKINSDKKYILGHFSKGKSYHRTKKMKKERSIQQTKKWQDPNYAKKQLKAIREGLQLKPTKPEKKLRKTLNKLFPNKYKYVGNNITFFIGRKCPDFINTNNQKKIIELFGDYWHGEEYTGRTKHQEEQRRIRHFAKYGFKTLIIWQYELKDTKKLKRKLRKFHTKKDVAEESKENIKRLRKEILE